MHFMHPALLDYTANGVVQGRIGNRDLNYAPHGAYPVQGEDRWVAIACETDEQWQALVGVVPELAAQGDEFQRATATASGRLGMQDELDRMIGAYTTTQEESAIVAALQNVGVPASLVQSSPDLTVDPQLLHQNHFVPLPHHEGGNTVVENSRIRLSRTPAVMDTSAPTFGRDMMFVLNDVLGYDDDRLGELLVSGALE